MLAISSSIGSHACTSEENSTPRKELVAEQTTYKTIKEAEKKLNTSALQINASIV